MTVRYRKAVRADIPAILRVQKHDGFPHQYYLTKERIVRLMKREYFYVACIGDRIIGFGSVDCEIRAQVHFICVDSAYRGRGIGRALMSTCIRQARCRGCARIHSFVEENSSKERFLQTLGFVQVGTYLDRYGNGVNASIWERGTLQPVSK